MAKGNYLSGILFIAALLFCGSTAGFCVEYRVSGIKYQVSGIKYQDRSAVTENGGGFSDSWRKRSLYQVSGIRYQDRSAVTEYGGGFSDSRRKRSLYQVSGIRYQDGRRKRSLVKHIYDSQIGIREQGTNSGPQIEKYLKYVGLAKGQPWCAAFVCWVFREAGVVNPRSGWSPDLFPASKIIWERTGKSQLGTRNPVMLPVTGCLLRGWTDNENINFTQHNPQHATRNLQLTRNRQPATRNPQLTRNPQPTTADIFGIYFPEKKRIAHVGFIDSWDGSWLITVEGNTNEAGSREGDGVYRKRRLVRSIYQVARYID